MPGILVVNYKAYETAFSGVGLKLAEEAGKVAGKLGVRVILAVPSLVAVRVTGVYDDVYVQHVDPVGFGAHTGYTPPQSLKYVGVRGSIVNHSEHKLIYRDVARIVEGLRSAGLESLVCADTPGEAEGLAHLGPTMIAVEPPELIGTGIPVSKAKPEVITSAVEAVRRVADIPVLAGAGITGSSDVERAVELGARGVLVASAVMKAKSPTQKLWELAEPLASI
ncbi:triose-phosphate isomerase [Stetteria hydrogenophila]